MANTWHVHSYSGLTTGIPFGSAKWMFDVFNSSSSSRYIRVYRIWVFNNNTTAVTGVLTQLQVRKTNSMSGGSTLTPIAHDLTNSALNANTTAGYGRTCGYPTNNLLRQFVWSNDEIAVASGILAVDIDSCECLVPVAQIWDVGYGDSSVKPVTLRASNDEGVGVFHPGTSTVGVLAAECEFTDGAS
jgi:hypothetical protein